MEPIGECIPITDGLHCCPTCDFQTVLLPNLQTHINSVHGETSDFEWKLPAAEIHRQMLSYKNDRFVDLAKRKPTERQAKPKKKIRTVFRCQLVAPPPPPVILAVQSLQIDQNETSAEPSESAITATIDNVLSTLRDSIESDSSEPLRALSGVELPDVELMTVSDEFRKNFESILEAKNLRPLESLPNVWASVPQPYTDAVAAVFENRMSSYAAADTFKLKRNSLRKYLNDTFNQLKRLGIASVYSSSDNRYFFYECQDLVAEMDILSSSVQTSLASPRSQMPRVGSSPSYDGSTSIEERILRGIEDLKITCSDEDYHKRLAVAVTSVINKTKSVGLAAGEYLVEPSDVVEVVVFLCKNYSDVTHWSSHVYSHLSYEEFRHLVYSYPFKVNIPEEEMESIAEGLYAASASGANLRFICARYRLLYPRLYHMMKVLQSKEILKNKRIIGPLSETRYFKKLRGDTKKFPLKREKLLPKTSSTATDIEVARKVTDILNSVARLGTHPARTDMVSPTATPIALEVPVTPPSKLDLPASPPHSIRSPSKSGSVPMGHSNSGVNLLSASQETALIRCIKCLEQAGLPVPGEFVIEVATELCKKAGSHTQSQIANFFTPQWWQEFSQRTC